MTMGLWAMTADRCPDCGALYVLVGIRHRCVPRPASVKKPPKVKKSKPK